MPTEAEVMELAERCEKASGPDRELDADIYWAVERKRALHTYNTAALGLPIRPEDAPERLQGGLGRAAVRAMAPRYTESVDAVMWLLPAGMDYELKSLAYRKGHGATLWEPSSEFNVGRSDAATAALALCAAALRARATLQDRGGCK